MISPDIWHRLLEHYDHLNNLTSAKQQLLQAQAVLMKLPANTLVFDEQQTCQGFPLVLQGGVRVVKGSASGRELPLYRVNSGEACVLTSGCLLGGQRYDARGVTFSDTEIVLIPAALFDQLLEERNFRHFVFRIFNERITELMQLISEVAFKKLDQRLAGLLLARGKHIHATHQQLADELGSVREIVTRLLKGFSSQGWVSLGREHIEVLDEASLKKIVAE